MLKTSAATLCVVCAIEALHAFFGGRSLILTATTHRALVEEELSNEKKKNSPSPDGKFNGFDLYYVNHPPKSKVHCVGENFQRKSRSWMFRSCEYKNLCFDITHQEFVVHQNEPLSMPIQWWSSTQILDPGLTAVAGGSQPKTWFPAIAQDELHLQTRIGQFRPFINPEAPPSGYFQLNATLLPFYRHPTSFRNPGHLVWDDFLGLYTLLDIFDREHDKLWLAQMTRRKTPEFEEPTFPFDVMKKFLPLFGRHEYDLNISNFDFQVTNPHLVKPNETILVCAKHGLTGSGLFSDHGGDHWHGQSEADRVQPYNTGRGGLFRRYRRFVMNNLGINPDTPMMSTNPTTILFSERSSTKASRANLTFAPHVDALHRSMGDRVQAHAVDMPSLSLHQQVEMVSKATVYVTAAGGGSVSALFLPKGAHLILYYRPYHYLDYDFWNNFPHIHVHWLSMMGYNNTNHTHFAKFVELVETIVLDGEGTSSQEE